MIGNVIQKNKMVLVFNNKGKLLYSKIGLLKTATSYNVTVQYGKKLLTFDSKGKLVFSKTI